MWYTENDQCLLSSFLCWYHCISELPQQCCSDISSFPFKFLFCTLVLTVDVICLQEEENTEFLFKSNLKVAQHFSFALLDSLVYSFPLLARDFFKLNFLNSLQWIGRLPFAQVCDDSYIWAKICLMNYLTKLWS